VSHQPPDCFASFAEHFVCKICPCSRALLFVHLGSIILSFAVLLMDLGLFPLGAVLRHVCTSVSKLSDHKLQIHREAAMYREAVYAFAQLLSQQLPFLHVLSNTELVRLLFIFAHLVGS
jgi:hypothetical protein